MMSLKRKNTILYVAIGLIAYLICIFLALHVGTAMYNGSTTIEAILIGVDTAFSSPFNVIICAETINAIIAFTVLFGGLAAFLFFDHQRNKHDLAGKESGSAQWNKDLKAYNKNYTDPHNSESNSGPNNLILSQNVFLNMNTRKTMRNNNVVIVGGSGTGKSRFYVKPNILQANCNYVITDPAGDLLRSTGSFLKEQGYNVKVFNLVEMSKSNCYNPFHYIRDDQGVLMMINCLIQNTNPRGKSSGDPFWEKSETALLQALCFYLIKYRPKEEQNFTSVMRLLRAAEIDENNPNSKSKLDRIFDEVAIRDPASIALKQYQTFKMGAGKTLKSILISCSVRLTVFNLHQIESLTRTDNLHLEELGGLNKDDKQVLFVIIPAADNTFNFLVSMMYSQLFETLYFVAETQCTNGVLSCPVRFLLDEFANIGQIPDFTQKLSTMRKYDISCNIILQNLAQVKTLYKDDWETIIGNSDSFIFLGGQEYSTLEYISKELGDQTITVRDRSYSTGKGGGNKNFKQTSRKLMFPDELGKMPNEDCIIMIRGLHPFYDKKYDYVKHQNYKHTGDCDESLAYVNTQNNTVKHSREELENTHANIKAKTYEKSINNPNPNSRIISDIMGPEALVKSLNLTECSDLFKRFVLISSDALAAEESLNAKSNDTQQNVAPQQELHPSPLNSVVVNETEAKTETETDSYELVIQDKSNKVTTPMSPTVTNIQQDNQQGVHEKNDKKASYNPQPVMQSPPVNDSENHNYQVASEKQNEKNVEQTGTTHQEQGVIAKISEKTALKIECKQEDEEVAKKESSFSDPIPVPLDKKCDEAQKSTHEKEPQKQSKPKENTSVKTEKEIMPDAKPKNTDSNDSDNVDTWFFS